VEKLIQAQPEKKNSHLISVERKGSLYILLCNKVYYNIDMFIESIAVIPVHTDKYLTN